MSESEYEYDDSDSSDSDSSGYVISFEKLTEDQKRDLAITPLYLRPPRPKRSWDEIYNSLRSIIPVKRGNPSCCQDGLWCDWHGHQIENVFRTELGIPWGKKCEFCGRDFMGVHDCPDRPLMTTDQILEHITVKCTYCGGRHTRKFCPIMKAHKDRLCPFCGLYGHGDDPYKKCNKIKIGPNGKVGFCTYSACKKLKDQWGHYMVTCPRREEAQGIYEFKQGENPTLAYAQPIPIKKK